MSLAGQNLQANRFAVTPRTLAFLTRPGAVLLLRLPDMLPGWGGKYNGLGGHIDPGEDPLSSARREIVEEIGLTPHSLWLCGVVLVATGGLGGIGLYVFKGTLSDGNPRPGPEGVPEWIGLDRLPDLPLVDDLPMLLPRVLRQRRSAAPFSAVYTYDAQGKLGIRFGT